MPGDPPPKWCRPRCSEPLERCSRREAKDPFENAPDRPVRLSAVPEQRRPDEELERDEEWPGPHLAPERQHHQPPHGPADPDPAHPPGRQPVPAVAAPNRPTPTIPNPYTRVRDHRPLRREAEPYGPDGGRRRPQPPAGGSRRDHRFVPLIDRFNAPNCPGGDSLLLRRTSWRSRCRPSHRPIPAPAGTNTRSHGVRVPAPMSIT